LPENPEGESALRDRLASLALPVAAGAGNPTFDGKRIALDANDLGISAIRLDTGESGDTLTIDTAAGTQVVALGKGAWQAGSANLRGRGEEPIASSGAATSDTSYEVRVCLVESETAWVVRISADGTVATVEYSPNVVSFGGSESNTIAGHVEG
jgi:hypothetical protein